MKRELRSRLIAAGAAKLADALLDLAQRSDAAVDSVARITSSPEEVLARFTSKLDDLREPDRFYHWRDLDELVNRLEGMLADLETADPDPRRAVELLLELLAADGAVMESCQDSGGTVEDVFIRSACESFARFARRLNDVDLLVEILIEHLAGDEYGLRGHLVASAPDFLDEPGVRRLIDALIRKSAATEDESYCWRCLRAVQSLATRLGDPVLFERARRAERPELTAPDAVAIARRYLAAGKSAEAIEGLQRFDGGGSAWGHHADTRDELLLDAYISLRELGSAADVAWRRFHRFRNDETLEELVALIGEPHREAVIADEARAIAASPSFRVTDAEFLVRHDRFVVAEAYVIERADQLDGGMYVALRQIAGRLASGGCPLAATLLYRALLDTVLERGNTAAYPNGARYLRRLDALAPEVADWRRFPDHAAYAAGIRKAHGRKHRFWQCYDEAKPADR
jgi:hypothetical protein